MKKLWAVGFGGMAGSLLRAAVYEASPETFTLWIVNLSGSFLLGLFSIRFAGRRAQEVRLFIMTGLLGSFTTFSAFSAQWFALVTESFMPGLLYGIMMTAAAVAMALLGMHIGRGRGAQ